MYYLRELVGTTKSGKPKTKTHYICDRTCILWTYKDGKKEIIAFTPKQGDADADEGEL